MEVHVRGKRMSVGDDLRRFAEDKVGRSARVFDDAGAIDVEFTDESNPRQADERCRVEITTKAGGHLVRVEAAAFDHRSALDLAVDKLERQLSRLKERQVARYRRGGDKQLNSASESVEETGGTAELRIERVKQFAVKPMTLEEAALQMELLGHSFYLFLNAESGQYSVLYRRRGGSLGLIEPQ
ncbi:MAG: ribosomal subunit interface protein [Actinobacteria bacterium]|nr:ribosomal subunit interface protein [Actinomycetota bacterium]